MAVITLTKQNFQKEVLESDKPVLVDFWAPWCGPCRLTTPVIDEIAEEHPELKVGKVNVDAQEALAAEYNIMSIPALFIFKAGKIVNQAVGAKQKEEILTMFN